MPYPPQVFGFPVLSRCYPAVARCSLINLSAIPLALSTGRAICACGLYRYAPYTFTIFWGTYCSSHFVISLPRNFIPTHISSLWNQIARLLRQCPSATRIVCLIALLLYVYYLVIRHATNADVSGGRVGKIRRICANRKPGQGSGHPRHSH